MNKEVFQEFEVGSNFNEQVLIVNALENNVTVDEKITNEIKDNESVGRIRREFKF